MTDWEKIKNAGKWLWDNFYALLICAFYVLVGIVALGDAFWRVFHREWLQCGKDLLVAAVVFPGAYGIWHFFKWTNKLFKKWIDKSPKT